MTYAETVTENGGEMNEKDEAQHETVEGRATDGRWMDTVRDRIHRVSGKSLSRKLSNHVVHPADGGGRNGIYDPLCHSRSRWGGEDAM